MKAHFIKLPISLYNKKLAELDVKHPDILSELYINPLEIVAVREGMDDDEEMTNSCIYLKNGETFIVLMHINKLIEVMGIK